METPAYDNLNTLHEIESTHKGKSILIKAIGYRPTLLTTIAEVIYVPAEDKYRPDFFTQLASLRYTKALLSSLMESSEFLNIKYSYPVSEFSMKICYVTDINVSISAAKVPPLYPKMILLREDFDFFTLD